MAALAVLAALAVTVVMEQLVLRWPLKPFPALLARQELVEIPVEHPVQIHLLRARVAPQWLAEVGVDLAEMLQTVGPARHKVVGLVV